MAGRIARGWELFKQSWSVLSLDKELLIFPVLSTIACVLVAASFAVPVLAIPELRNAVFQAAQEEQANGGFQAQAGGVLSAVVGFLFYFANFFVIVFFNTALVSAALIRFRGGNPTVGDGLRAAGARLPQIFAWALLAATVGIILRTLEERLSFLGRLIVGLIGVGWAVVTYLVVPTLAAEGLGPVAAVKRSAQLIRKTWGEALVGQMSLGIVGFLLVLPTILFVIGSIFAGAYFESVWPVAIGIGLAVLYGVLASIITSAVQQIFLAAVYLYAAEGQTPAGFSQELLESAFRRKGE